MSELLDHLLHAPVGGLCILGGFVFLFIAVAGEIKGRIQPGAAGRLAAGALGAILLIYGVWITFDRQPFGPPPPPPGDERRPPDPHPPPRPPEPPR